MKKVFFTIVMGLLISEAMNAQTVNNVPVSEIDADYIMIRSEAKLFSKKVNITIDFGQRVKAFNSNVTMAFRDEEGKRVTFNSDVDAVNYMSSNGYQVVQAYGVMGNGNQVTYY